MRVLPRRFRSHTVQLIKQLHEDDNGVAAEQVITILHVKADPSYGMQQSKRGITTDDKIIVYIELGDYTAYDENDRVLQYGTDFIISTNDTLKFRDDEYTITGVNEIFLDGTKPIRVEMTGK